MTTKVERTMSMAVNIAILIVAVAFVLFVGQNLLDRHRAGQQPEAIAKGQSIALPAGGDLGGGKVAVIALQVGCHFCSESMPFYRTLAAKATKTNTHLIWVLPNPHDQSLAYLKSNEVAAADVRQANLSSLHVRGTPTIVLLGTDRKVQNFWIGKLPEQSQLEVERALE